MLGSAENRGSGLAKSWSRSEGVGKPSRPGAAVTHFILQFFLRFLDCFISSPCPLDTIQLLKTSRRP